MISSKEIFQQVQNLQKAYAAASKVEGQIKSMKNIVEDAMKSNHALLALLTPHTCASVAEHTIKQYRKPECWGCKASDHVYADRNGNVICPKGNDPAIKAEADKMRKEWKQCQKRK